MKQIIIRQSSVNSKEYEARFIDEFLQATFYLVFTDNIYGAVALNRFAEMIKTFYEIKHIPLTIEEQESKNSSLIEFIANMPEPLKTNWSRGIM